MRDDGHPLDAHVGLVLGCNRDPDIMIPTAKRVPLGNTPSLGTVIWANSHVPADTAKTGFDPLTGEGHQTQSPKPGSVYAMLKSTIPSMGP